MHAKIFYDKGTILIMGDLAIPSSSWDSRAGAYRAMALFYRDIIEYLKRSNVNYVDDALELLPTPYLQCKVKLKNFQHEALKAWLDAGKRGTVVLPTGSGKTVIAVAAISELKTPTIVIVPTLDLVEQWQRVLTNEFNIEIGVYGGGENVLQPITVSTYDSAYLRAGELGNRFGLIIFDEVHHLPSTGFRHIAEMFAAPYRMGLTATYERQDGLHKDLPRLVGGKVYELSVEHLAGRHLSEYELEKLYVDLTLEEEEEYERLYKTFIDYLVKRNIILRTPHDFTKFIMRSGRDQKARQALLARNKALDIALNSQKKLDALENILLDQPTEPTIIFTQHNKLVHRIAQRFLIPYITHVTPKDERKEILDNFRAGKYRLIVTSKVLDEGIDVPDATQAIILSGTGSTREFIQRLGRILRKREGKKAKLIEIVTRNTAEMKMSSRRKQTRRDDASIESTDY
ncbi:MAG TPA: DEAD/DEAH box helicase family protein [Candidatus Acidoferrum sp.]|nr:DEAD/DEAH box helicase family protein [Candidatus Acidoferrum sp.]